MLPFCCNIDFYSVITKLIITQLQRKDHQIEQLRRQLQRYTQRLHEVNENNHQKQTEAEQQYLSKQLMKYERQLVSTSKEFIETSMIQQTEQDKAADTGDEGEVEVKVKVEPDVADKDTNKTKRLTPIPVAETASSSSSSTDAQTQVQRVEKDVNPIFSINSLASASAAETLRPMFTKFYQLLHVSADTASENARLSHSVHKYKQKKIFWEKKARSAIEKFNLLKEKYASLVNSHDLSRYSPLSYSQSPTPLSDRKRSNMGGAGEYDGLLAEFEENKKKWRAKARVYEQRLSVAAKLSSLCQQKDVLLQEILVEKKSIINENQTLEDQLEGLIHDNGRLKDVLNQSYDSTDFPEVPVVNVDLDLAPNS